LFLFITADCSCVSSLTGPKLFEGQPAHKSEMFSPAWRHEDKTTRYRFCIYLLCSNRNFRPTLLAVLGIQDVKPESRFFDIQDPGSWISEVFLTVKFIKKALKNMDWIRDSVSEIWDLEKTYPGSWIHIHRPKNTVSWILGLD
jgi:hypothetical protein